MVGIPAYNEAANIGRLLDQLLAQRQDGFTLERIVVVSDGSSDDTCRVVERVNDPRVTLVAETARAGQAARQSQMRALCRTDVLVCLDADISLPHPDVLRGLVGPVIADGADLVSCRLDAAPPRGFVEKVLASGLDLRNTVAETYRRGDNIYTCHGTARALSRRMCKLYASTGYGNGVGEDAYSYLFAKRHGLTYRYTCDASVQVKLPSRLSDHWLQSARFQQNAAEMRLHFPASAVRAQVLVPPRLCLRGLWAELRKSPYVLAYLVLLGFTILTTSKKPSRVTAWKVATSTKQPRFAYTRRPPGAKGIAPLSIWRRPTRTAGAERRQSGLQPDQAAISPGSTR